MDNSPSRYSYHNDNGSACNGSRKRCRRGRHCDLGFGVADVYRDERPLRAVHHQRFQRGIDSPSGSGARSPVMPDGDNIRRENVSVARRDYSRLRWGSSCCRVQPSGE